MPKSKSLEILKQAILLEKRGKNFYSKVAEQTSHSSVKDFFELMAEEEQNHINLLHAQYKSLKEHGMFQSHDLSASPTDAAEKVLTEEVCKLISGADYESAAISAAISMEEKAIQLYSERVEKSVDEEEKKLYTWLVGWEKKHLHMLADLDRVITEKIWNDNNFWPF
jgi:rubrerythrin